MRNLSEAGLKDKFQFVRILLTQRIAGDIPKGRMVGVFGETREIETREINAILCFAPFNLSGIEFKPNECIGSFLSSYPISGRCLTSQELTQIRHHIL